MPTSIQLNLPAKYNVVVFILLFFLVGCNSSEKTKEKTEPDLGEATVALIVNSRITANEFKAYLRDRNPSTKEPTIIEKNINARLQEMITAEILFQEAIHMHIDQDPEYRRTVRQILGQKLIQKKVIQPITQETVSDMEIQDYYNKHITEFSRQEQIRVADIFFAVPNNASTEERLKILSKATIILTEIQGSSKTRFWFSEFIEKYSDIHPQYVKGDTGFFDKNGDLAEFEPEFVEQAFNIDDIGVVSRQLLETPAGFHISMLVGRQPPFHQDIFDVSVQIEQRIRREKLATAKTIFIENLLSKHNVKKNRILLNTIKNQYIKEQMLNVPLKAEDEAKKRIAPPSFPNR